MKHLFILFLFNFSMVAAQAHSYSHDFHSSHDMAPSCEYCLSASQTQSIENPQPLVEIIPPTFVSFWRLSKESFSSLNDTLLPPSRGPPAFI